MTDPAPAMCGRGHVLDSIEAVAVLAKRIACAQCMDEANTEYQAAFGESLSARKRRARHASQAHTADVTPS